MTNLVFLFPGQSSRYPGMLGKLAALHPACAEVLARASDQLRRDLQRQYAADNPEAYARNVDVQVGVFLANEMMAALLAEAGVHAGFSLGLSLGEYNHLVHIGALSFTDALTTVEARGHAYDDGPRGWMASIQPMDHDDLVDALAEHPAGARVEIVNLNSPRQNVIAGDPEAIQQIVAYLEDEHYQQPVIIERQVPMHASIFAPVGAAFRAHLEGVAFRRPRLPYLPNRLGRIVPSPTREDFVELLASHVHAPVLWRASIDHILEHVPKALFIEVGGKQVLANLLDRKWTKRPRFVTDSRDETAHHLDVVFSALGVPFRLCGGPRSTQPDLPPPAPA